MQEEEYKTKMDELHEKYAKTKKKSQKIEWQQEIEKLTKELRTFVDKLTLKDVLEYTVDKDYLNIKDLLIKDLKHYMQASQTEFEKLLPQQKEDFKKTSDQVLISTFAHNDQLRECTNFLTELSLRTKQSLK